MTQQIWVQGLIFGSKYVSLNTKLFHFLTAIAAVIIYLLFNVSLHKLDSNFPASTGVDYYGHYSDIKNYISINLFNTNNQTSLVRDINGPYGSGEEGTINSFVTGELQTSAGGELSPHSEPYRTSGSLLTMKITDQQLLNLFWEFLPYLAIVLLNLLVPLIFNYLVKFEQYSPVFVIKVSLMRTVFLRLSSLMVLLSRFYYLISKNLGTQECYNNDKGTPPCWETFVGQQFYKLFITDFATHCFVTFFINFPRALIARHFSSRFAKFIGEQEFELSKHVLDIVYTQTLCWLGTFYAPFLPLIASILNFFMFYVKKFACLNNSKPSVMLYRASRSNSLFMFILLVSYTIAVVPVVYAIAEIIPSRTCGPFRGNDSVWDTAIGAFLRMPLFIQNIIFFVGSASFAVPFFITLVLFLYYYYAVSAANKKFVELLRNQLVLEGHDKQFLLNRLSTFIKQQQEYQKRIRHVEMQRDNREKHREKEPPTMDN